MRELKFRAWDKTLKEILPNVQNHINDKEWAFGAMLNNDRWVIQQYTGFKDNKGKEIYEGDILSDWTETDEGIIQSKMQVFWCDKSGAWRLDNSYEQDKSSGDLLSEELWDFSYEVTENIYEVQ